MLMRKKTVKKNMESQSLFECGVKRRKTPTQIIVFANTTRMMASGNL